MEADLLNATVAPESIGLELSADRTAIDKGQSSTLQWRADGDAELTLWKGEEAIDPDSIDWRRFLDLGERVDRTGRQLLTPAETTHCWLVARTPVGIRGEHVVIEVRDGRGKYVEPVTWSPKPELLNRMEQHAYSRQPRPPHDRQPGVLLAPLEKVLQWAHQWSAGGGPPGISVTTSHEVIFENETATVTWSVTDATCATPGYSVVSHRLIPGSICGTQLDGASVGFGGYPPCVGTSGNATFPQLPMIGSSHIVMGVSAINSSKSASAAVWIDILSLPQFNGAATAGRVAAIKTAIKNIDKNLRAGCIYNDASLDVTVPAFKNGQLNRKTFWWRLLVELQNLKLDSFVCNDVADNNWGGGHWGDYGNDVILEWSPSHTPNLEYVILHELVHKCGFNSALPYSHNDIENQAHAVSGSCYP